MATPSARESYLLRVLEYIDRLFSLQSEAHDIETTQSLRDLNIPEVNHILRLVDCIAFDKKPKKPMQFSFRLRDCRCLNGYQCEECSDSLRSMASRTPNAQLQAARALLISRINEFVRDAVLAKYDELHASKRTFHKSTQEPSSKVSTGSNAWTDKKAFAKQPAPPASASGAPSHSIDLRSQSQLVLLSALGKAEPQPFLLARDDDPSSDWCEVGSTKKKVVQPVAAAAAAATPTADRVQPHRLTRGRMIPDSVSAAPSVVDVHVALPVSGRAPTQPRSGVRPATATSAAPPIAVSARAVAVALPQPISAAVDIVPGSQFGALNTVPAQLVQLVEPAQPVLAVSANAGCPNCARLQRQLDDCLEQRERAVCPNCAELQRQLDDCRENRDVHNLEMADMWVYIRDSQAQMSGLRSEIARLSQNDAVREAEYRTLSAAVERLRNHAANAAMVAQD